MALIIACHMLQYYDNELCYWLNIGVQIFFLISGFLYGRKAIENPIAFLSKGFKKILIPYWAFLFAAIVLYVLFARESLNINSVFKAVFCAGTIKGLGHLWFVGYILFCYLLTPYLYWMRKMAEDYSFVESITFYAAMLIAVQLLGLAFESYFLPDRVACYLIGFFIPSLARKANKGVKSRLFVSTIVIAFLMNAARIYFKYIAVGLIPEKAVNALVRYAHMMLGVALFLILFTCLRNRTHSSRWLMWSDQYSYPIYLVHLLFILSPFTLMDLTRFQILNWIVVLAATSCSAMLLHHVTQRVLAKYERR